MRFPFDAATVGQPPQGSADRTAALRRAKTANAVARRAGGASLRTGPVQRALHSRGAQPLRREPSQSRRNSDRGLRVKLPLLRAELAALPGNSCMIAARPISFACRATPPSSLPRMPAADSTFDRGPALAHPGHDRQPQRSGGARSCSASTAGGGRAGRSAPGRRGRVDLAEGKTWRDLQRDHTRRAVARFPLRGPRRFRYESRRGRHRPGGRRWPVAQRCWRRAGAAPGRTPDAPPGCVERLRGARGWRSGIFSARLHCAPVASDRAASGLSYRSALICERRMSQADPAGELRPRRTATSVLARACNVPPVAATTGSRQPRLGRWPRCRPDVYLPQVPGSRESRPRRSRYRARTNPAHDRRWRNPPGRPLRPSSRWRSPSAWSSSASRPASS